MYGEGLHGSETRPNTEALLRGLQGHVGFII